MPPPRPSPRFQSRAHNAATDDPEDAQEDAAEDETDDDDCEDGDDIDLIRAKRAQRERPLSFANMSEVKSRFESGAELTKEERREERKQEIQNIRSRLFMGKQAKIKEMYQQAVLDSEQGVRAVDRRADAVMADMGDRARSIKDRFEKGQVFRGDGQDGGEAAQPAVHQVDEDAAVFEQGNERGQGKFRKGNIKGDFFVVRRSGQAVPLAVHGNGCECGSDAQPPVAAADTDATDARDPQPRGPSKHRLASTFLPLQGTAFALARPNHHK